MLTVLDCEEKLTTINNNSNPEILATDGANIIQFMTDNPNTSNDIILCTSLPIHENLSSIDVGHIDNIVFGDTDITEIEKDPSVLESIDNLSTIRFKKNIGLCSTKNDSFVSGNNTTNYDTRLEEYAPLRKKIKCSKLPSKAVEMISQPPTVANSMRDGNGNVYINYGETISFGEKDEMYIKSNILLSGDYNVGVKYLQDIIREKYKLINNVCPLNFVSNRLNQKNSILILYGQCKYFNDGCLKHKFSLALDTSPLMVHIYSTGTKIQHTKMIKKHQLRGVSRALEKRVIKYMKASNWRDLKLCARSNQLKRLGNNQKLLSKEAARKMKQEEMRSLDYDKDMHIDLCKMSVEEKWKGFIQNGLSRETYLFFEKPLSILQANNKKLLKYSRNTLFFDATGSIVPKFDKNSKRVFLYSLVAHIRTSKSETGILLPVAEAFLSSHYANDVAGFLLKLETFCNQHAISWPIAARICTDWSTVLINATLKIFNSTSKGNTLENYISACYEFSSTKVKPTMVVIQICCSHFLRIVDKDIKSIKIPENVSNFFKWQLFSAVNISDFKIFFNWLKCMFVILLNKNKTTEVRRCLKELKFSIESDKTEMLSSEDRLDGDNTLTALYKKSPFYIKALSINNEVEKSMKTNGPSNEFYNQEFFNILLKKYVPYAPLWTNLMGVFIDDTGTRISNSPAEGYFHQLKNVILNQERYIRPSVYIRKSKIYIDAKLSEIEDIFLNDEIDDDILDKQVVKLDEEQWMKTPKKAKSKIGKNLIYKRTVCRITKSVFSKQKYVLLKYSNIYAITQCRITDVPMINFNEFLCLKKQQQLHGNVIDIFLAILIFNSKKNGFSITCEQGGNFFYIKNITRLDLPLENYEHIFIPVFEIDHFTLVYINTKNCSFTYINPMGETLRKVESLFKIFKMHNGLNDSWRCEKLEHKRQTDAFNCGVFVCQFVEALLQGSKLSEIDDANSYRDKMITIFVDNTDKMAEICLHCGLRSLTNVCSDCERPVCDPCWKFVYKKGNLIDQFKCTFCTDISESETNETV